jgi:hypothetical protein
MQICKKSVIIGFVMGLIICLIGATLTMKPSQQQFVYVNFEKVISHVMSQVNQSNSSEMVTEEVENYKGLFVKTLDEYAKSNNAIIFSSPKPVSGAKDATDLLIERAFGKQIITKEGKEGKDSD